MKIKTKILLYCGIAAAVLYIGADIVASLAYNGYSYSDQAISELSAIGAPTRRLWLILTFPFNLLLIAFGMGVMQAAGNKRSLRIAGALLTLWGIVGYAWYFFPMNMRGAIGSTTDTMHLVLAGLTVLFITLFIGFGSGARGMEFRIYSILTIAAVLIFGALVGMQAPRVAAQLPTPWMGIQERISVYAPMIWMGMLAVLLLRGEKMRVVDTNMRVPETYEV